MKKPLFDLQGKSGVILGGAGIMGQEFTKVLTDFGARLLIADINESKTGESLFLKCDAKNPNDIKAVFARAKKEWGKIDFYVHNVMAKPQGYYDDTDHYSESTWDEVFETNVRAAFLASREAKALMPEGGSIVLTGSIYGLLSPDQRIYKDCKPSANPYFKGAKLSAPLAYTASKASLIGIGKHLATLYAPDRIRVNVLTPGGIYDGQEESFHAEYRKRTPLNRMAEKTDYNGAIVFLVSDASSYMTGANLVIDGGLSAW